MGRLSIWQVKVSLGVNLLTTKVRSLPDYSGASLLKREGAREFLFGIGEG